MKLIFFLFFLLLKIINSTLVYPNPADLVPIELKPIISIGNFCPYKNYGVQVTINKINYLLVLDSQNSVTTVFSRECKYGCLRLPRMYLPTKRTIFDKVTSKGFFKDSTAWEGNIVGEKITLNHNFTTKTEIKLVAVSSQSRPPQNAICQASSILANGVLGIGQSKEINSFVRQFTTMNNVPPVFSLTMCPENPRIWFGGYDPSVLDNPKKFAFTKSETDSYSFTISNVYIGGNTLYQVSDFVWKTELDTSTPFIHLPSSVFHQAIQVLSRERSFSKYFSARFFTERKCVLNPLTNFTVEQINELLPTFRVVFKSNLPNSEITLNAVPSYLVIQGDKACPGIVESLDYNSRFGVSLFMQYMVLFDQVEGRVGIGKANCKPNRWVVGSDWDECKKSEDDSDCEMQTRSLKCISPKNKRLNETLCKNELKPIYQRPCYRSEDDSSAVDGDSAESMEETIAPKHTNTSRTRMRKTPAPVVKTKRPTTGCVIEPGKWKIEGTWSDCDQICGTGAQRRKVICVSKDGELLEDIKCDAKSKPPFERVCGVGKCLAEYHWDTSDWSGCSTQCGEGYQTRFSTCIDSSVWRNVDNLNCKGPEPVLKRECLGQPLCSKYRWDWEPCEPNCPEMAYVYCYNATSKVDNSFCKQIPNIFIPVDCKCYRTRKSLGAADSTLGSESSNTIGSLINFKSFLLKLLILLILTFIYLI
ncbi:hypothetical protein DICPUDRAFT_46880 [Dictyostelium purpureum]|uniref:Peptidase A1 domain-containing protein n=1 Tax=Dictyostelium purpureum TaxID=5786 RepID=F0ZGR2_DICPU|nr:uncharacterized protein DICPUDRAFT_46880 [Dictyostelium purpureum]EGC36870.1 hypothetical protein DICPUDRAFT_46880 [Dictyostelium purpureum]|eukprot:XP_003286592.1 hypothetical protein DICPUDRAFT_46880 [Dictyostelium purpureum]